MLSFTGRTGRIAWLLYVIVTVAAFLLAIAIYADFTAFSIEVLDHYPSEEERKEAGLMLIGVMAVSFLVLLAATIRRLRDAGSKNPLLGLILGLAIPGIGWFLLTIKLLFGKETDEVEAQQVTSRQTARDRVRQTERATGRPADRDQLIAHLAEMATKASKKGQVQSGRPERAREFINQVENASRQRKAAAAHVHVVNISPDGPTVRRYGRGLAAMGARKIGF